MTSRRRRVALPLALLICLSVSSRAAEVASAKNKPQGAHPVAPFVVLTLTPGALNSRNSEGDFIQTKDGRMLFIYSFFGQGRGGDDDTAELRERVSTDGGMTWSTTQGQRVLMGNLGKL
jgi:hypothetical protein